MCFAVAAAGQVEGTAFALLQFLHSVASTPAAKLYIASGDMVKVCGAVPLWQFLIQHLPATLLGFFPSLCIAGASALLLGGFTPFAAPGACDPRLLRGSPGCPCTGWVCALCVATGHRALMGTGGCSLGGRVDPQCAPPPLLLDLIMAWFAVRICV